MFLLYYQDILLTIDYVGISPQRNFGATGTIPFYYLSSKDKVGR